MSKEKLTNYADGSQPVSLEHFSEEKAHDSENCILCRLSKKS